MSLNELLDRLLREGKIKKQATDYRQINDLIQSAHRNFLAAKHILNDFPETAFKASYDGLLQIARALLLINGYRPDDGEQHKTTFLIAGKLLGNEFYDLSERIDKYRKTRNQAIYQPATFISREQATSIMNAAERYWRETKKHLINFSKQLNLFDF